MSILTPGVPWYRDITVLRIIAQVVFLVAFIASLIVLFSQLVSNLAASNLALDFEVYKRPFNVAIAEGMSITADWLWLKDTDGMERVVWGAWIILAGVAGFTAYRQYRQGKLHPALVAAAGVLLLFLFVSPPEQTAQWLSAILSDYLYSSSMTRALITGIVNTLTVVFFSLIACTLLGIFAGVGLLSSNFLVRNIARVYVEIFRNTPLAVQLIFIYRSLTLLLPVPRQSIFSPSNIGPIQIPNSYFIFNARGFYFPSLNPTESTPFFIGAFLLSLVVAWRVRRWRLAHQDNTGEPARPWRYMVPVVIGITIVGWLLAGGWPLSGQPFTLEYPALRGPNVQGGFQLGIGFMSLFLGLTLYTGAFIADIVRAGIQSVPYGQIEAARAQGLSRSHVLNLIVLPQALRLIIPPLGNQYVNLGKNSSLGLIVNYVDTYRIAQLANNESGQAVPFFVGLMVIYLTLSLALSLLTNFLNRTTQITIR